jgi:hypothetical protein
VSDPGSDNPREGNELAVQRNITVTSEDPIACGIAISGRSHGLYAAYLFGLLNFLARSDFSDPLFKRKLKKIMASELINNPNVKLCGQWLKCPDY